MALRNDSGGVREENDQSRGCEQGDSGETKSSLHTYDEPIPPVLCLGTPVRRQKLQNCYHNAPYMALVGMLGVCALRVHSS